MGKFTRERQSKTALRRRLESQHAGSGGANGTETLSKLTVPARVREVRAWVKRVEDDGGDVDGWMDGWMNE